MISRDFERTILAENNASYVFSAKCMRPTADHFWRQHAPSHIQCSLPKTVNLSTFLRRFIWWHDTKYAMKLNRLLCSTVCLNSFPLTSHSIESTTFCCKFKVVYSVHLSQYYRLLYQLNAPTVYMTVQPFYTNMFVHRYAITREYIPNLKPVR